MITLENDRAARHTLSQPWWGATAFSVALIGLAVLWAGTDTRMVDAAKVWEKPLKFAVSFVVLFATMALVEPYFSAPWRNGRLFRGIAAMMTAAMLTEMIYMIFQAAQGQASHFNTATPFHAAMYAAMGVGAVTLVLGVALMGWAALRDQDATFGSGLRLGVGLGFIGSFVLTMITAGTMSSMAGHFIGTPAPGAAVIPLMGWSATVGDLRPAHFVALHAMQVLPLLGLWIDRRGFETRVIWLMAAVYALITLALFAQALLGIPVIRL